MLATLIVVGGKATKEKVSLDLPMVIGRSRSADLTVAHPMVSRRHCEIYDSSGLLMVRDLDSLNGTVVAGRKISEAALRPDDEFSVGPLTFRVDYEYSAETEESEEDSPVVEKPEEPQVEITCGSPELDEHSPGPTAVAPDIPPELEETLLEDESSGIAPRDGQLPDFSPRSAPFEDLDGRIDGDDEASAPVDPPPDPDGPNDFR